MYKGPILSHHNSLGKNWKTPSFSNVVCFFCTFCRDFLVRIKKVWLYSFLLFWVLKTTKIFFYNVSQNVFSVLYTFEENVVGCLGVTMERSIYIESYRKIFPLIGTVVHFDLSLPPSWIYPKKACKHHKKVITASSLNLNSSKAGCYTFGIVIKGFVIFWLYLNINRFINFWAINTFKI